MSARGRVRAGAARTRVGAGPWALSGGILAAIMGAALSINGVLLGWGWFPQSFLTVAAVLGTTALARSLRLPPVLVPVAGAAVLAMSLVFQFFRDTAHLGVLPSRRTFEVLAPLLRDTSDLVLGGSVPLPAEPGLLLLCCTGLGLLALLMDLLAVSLAFPAISGVALLGVVFVPALFKPDSIGLPAFAAAGAGYLLVLGLAQWYAPHGTFRPAGASAPASQVRRALGLGGAAVAALLVVPALIPGFTAGTFPQGARLTAFGQVSGVNPMVTLGNDLRSPSGGGQLFYATDAFTPLYLRSSTLEDFSGASWGPALRNDNRRLGPGSIFDPYASAPGVPTITTTTQISSPDFSSPWLPLPYAPQRVNGLSGRWTWDPETLTVLALDTTSLGQDYTTVSVMPQLSREALSAVDIPPRSSLDPLFRAIPPGTPDLIKETSLAVTGTAPTLYDKAMAIQDYLRGPAFTYSEQTPLREGYDGSGIDVVARFLQVKSGYCIHFSAAMAIMAREAGIPARIAVGYAPGRPTGKQVTVNGAELNQYMVDGHDAHAWPELYFEGLGWVPFEPTPSRGAVPTYARDQTAPGSPAQNNDDSLNPGIALPGATSTPAASPQAGPGAGTAEDGGAFWLATGAAGGSLAALALCAAPWLLRTARRRRRLAILRRAGGGSAPPGVAAWQELADTAVDYGFRLDPADTPRTLAARLLASEVLASEVLAPAAGTHGGGPRAAESPATTAAAVATLLDACERAQYGPPGGPAPGAALEPALAAVRAACARRASAPVRWRAVLAPPSLFNRSRALPAPPASPPLSPPAAPPAGARERRILR
ncbi:transglutaminaseTgpA domain-containing protein [Pseudarthrobacter sp. P1]|uniref:transglutaminase family protein n=1 Tax=Pseudarthrobacter sp. P1 TaxID=3418418 RepID=UPI003CF7B2D8